VRDQAPDIPGAGAVVAWFGYWPTFHDAEVTSIFLDRSGPSRVVVRTWHTTPQLGGQVYFVPTKHAIVTFRMEEFIEPSNEESNPRIENFNLQNVLSCALVKKTPDGYKLVLDGIYGVDAMFHIARMSVELVPGFPADNQYANKLTK